MFSVNSYSRIRSFQKSLKNNNTVVSKIKRVYGQIRTHDLLIDDHFSLFFIRFKLSDFYKIKIIVKNFVYGQIRTQDQSRSKYGQPT